MLRDMAIRLYAVSIPSRAATSRHTMHRKLSGSEITLSLFLAWVFGAVAFYLHPAFAAVGAGILLISLLLGFLDGC